MIQTENFKPSTDKRLLCTCGNHKCDKRSVNQGVLNMMQLVRDDAMRGLTVTSGGRCPNHPKEFCRITPADHQNCVGIDISVRGDLKINALVANSCLEESVLIPKGSALLLETNAATDTSYNANYYLRKIQ